MTKIRDLVTVSVDNVFRMFPVDSERYDLIVGCGLLVALISDGKFGKFFTAVRDSRVKTHLWGVWGNADLGAVSWLRVTYPAYYGEVLPFIVHDRARRFIASFSDEQVEHFTRDGRSYYDELMTAFWEGFLASLRCEHETQQLSTKGRRVPT